MSRDGAARLVLRTSEGVEFAYTIATPLRRFLALSIDLALVGIVVSMINTALAVFGLLAPDLVGLVSTVAGFVVSIGYFIQQESRRRGRTVGKQVMGLRVLDTRGRRLTLVQVVLRNLLRTLDQLPLFYLVGGAAAALSPRGQRLGDLAAGTVVVCEDRGRLAVRAEDPEPERYNSLRAAPHLAKRLRQALAPAEYKLACAALARRDALDPEARLRVFAGLAAHLRGLAPFPPELLEGVGDERFVRNVVEVVADHEAPQLR